MEDQITTDALFYSPVTLDLEVVGKLFWVCNTHRQLIISPAFLRRLAKHYKYPYEGGITTFPELLTQISREHYTRYSRFFRSINWLYVNCPLDRKTRIMQTGLVDLELLPKNDSILSQAYTDCLEVDTISASNDHAPIIVGKLIAGGHVDTLAVYPHITTTPDIHNNEAVGFALYSLDLEFVKTIHQSGTTMKTDYWIPFAYAVTINPFHLLPHKGYLTMKYLTEVIAYLTQHPFSKSIRGTLYYVVAAHDIPEYWEFLEAICPEWKPADATGCCVSYGAVKIFTQILTQASKDVVTRWKLDRELELHLQKNIPNEIKLIYDDFFHQPFPTKKAPCMKPGVGINEMLSLVSALTRVSQ